MVNELVMSCAATDNFSSIQKFREGLRSYLKTFAYKNAATGNTRRFSFSSCCT